MATTPASSGRRERNKQQKLDRITAAARELFTEYSVEEVTTQQIADKADIGTGTLFLYVKSKGELLLLIQNSLYAEALARGRASAEETEDALEAVLAIIRPVVECNRVHTGNGRTYLREMVFGDPEEPRHAEALAIVGQTEQAVAEVLRRDGLRDSADAATLARTTSALIFMSMAASVNAGHDADQVLADIREQLAVVLVRR
ncbi:TetR/AcrR family transcriptional regulator [Streptomyces sp. NBC_01589]|uniref:TetR/AcrR family transcriptional regulator n=1 Tax=Streptomyces sp. NBC_01589 TaxID=2975886 RepID=UPI003863B8EB